MPIHTGQDKDGQFYQWGKTGKKYYFDPNDKSSKQRALNKAKKQQTAIYSTGWKGDAMKLIRVKCRDVEVGNISVGLAENGKGVEISEGNLFYWDEKAGNITVNGKMYTYYIIRGRRKSKFGFNGGKILGITMPFRRPFLYHHE